MIPSLKPQMIGRYKDLALLLWKYGSASKLEGDFAELQAGTDEESSLESIAEAFTEDIEKLGPTYVKLGQLLSTRPDLVPIEFVDSLGRLQEKVEPLDFEEIKQVVERELAGSIKSLFSEFETKPLASASLGQVHRATTISGTEVVVKVQRPGVGPTIKADLEALDEIAQFFDENTEVGEHFEFGRIIDTLRSSLSKELDYEQERRLLEKMGKVLSSFENIVVPGAVAQYCSRRVLTMEYIPATSLSSLNPVVMLEKDGATLASDLFRAYLEQIVVHGFFHADPHPGNIQLTHDDRLVLFDLGMVGTIPSRQRDSLLQLILAVGDQNSERAIIASIDLGEKREMFDRQGFQEAVEELFSKYVSTDISDFNTGRVVLDIQKVAATNGLRLSKGITLLGKALLNLDKVLSSLDSSFDPAREVKKIAPIILAKRSLGGLSATSVYHKLISAEGFIDKLPHRLDSILEKLSEDSFSLELKGFEETAIIKAIQKIANRITCGLLLSSMIVAASVIMTIESRFSFLGYPVLALILLAISGVGTGILFFRSFLSDE